MDRNMLLWSVALFFGGFVLFGMLRRATENSSTGVTVAVQVGALVVVLVLVVVVARRVRGGGE